MKKFVFISLFAVLAALAVSPNGPSHRNPAFLGAIHVVSGLVSSNNMTMYLKLDDTPDNVWGTSFTENNTPTYGAGKINNGLLPEFADLSDPCNPILPKYISHGTDSPFDLAGTDFTIGLWMNPSDNSRDNFLLSKTSSGYDGYFIVLQGGNAFQVYIGRAVGGPQSLTASTFGLPANNTWCFVVVRVYSTTTIDISVNGGAWNTTTLTAAVLDSAADLNIGSDNDLAVGCGGVIDEAFIFKRKLSNAEVLQLYNSGAAARPNLP